MLSTLSTLTACVTAELHISLMLAGLQSFIGCSQF